jgi:hypothetical protein
MKAKLMAIIGLIFAMSIIIQAQVPTTTIGTGNPPATIATLPMMKSQDILRNYAMSIAVAGTRYVDAVSLDWNWSGRVSYAETNGAYGEEILQKLFTRELVYKLNNPDDNINGYVCLYDGQLNGNPVNILFFGSATYTFVDLKVGKPQYRLWMQDIPLPVSNIASAEVLALDSDGKTANRIQIKIDQNGHPLFQPWLAGSPNGILVLRNNNGLTMTYDLSNPVGETSTGMSESADYKVDSHYVYETVDKPITVKVIEVWNRPSIFLKVTGVNAAITFDVMGIVQDNKTYYERPVSMEVSLQGKDGSQVIPLNKDEPTEFKIQAGEYRIRFNWINFGKPNMIYTGPTDDGGAKG